MSNANAPFGFKPVRSLSGSEVITNYYQIASSSSRIGKGDLVKFSSGKIIRENSSVAVGPWLGVSLADSGVPAAGGVSAHPVCDDPNAIFYVQGSTAAWAVSNYGSIFKADCHTAPDANTGMSQSLLTNTGATAKNGVRLIRVNQQPDESIGASAILEVILNADVYHGEQA